MTPEGERFTFTVKAALDDPLRPISRVELARYRRGKSRLWRVSYDYRYGYGEEWVRRTDGLTLRSFRNAAAGLWDPSQKTFFIFDTLLFPAPRLFPEARVSGNWDWNPEAEPLLWEFSLEDTYRVAQLVLPSQHCVEVGVGTDYHRRMFVLDLWLRKYSHRYDDTAHVRLLLSKLVSDFPEAADWDEADLRLMLRLVSSGVGTTAAWEYINTLS